MGRSPEGHRNLLASLIRQRFDRRFFGRDQSLGLGGIGFDEEDADVDPLGQCEDRRRRRHECDIDIFALQRGQHCRPGYEFGICGHQSGLFEHPLIAGDKEPGRGAGLKPDAYRRVCGMTGRRECQSAEKQRNGSKYLLHHTLSLSRVHFPRQ
jgi:hypothetical protein